MRAAPVRAPALHSMYMMRPWRAVAFFVGDAWMPLRSEAVAIASGRAAFFLAGDLSIGLEVRIVVNRRPFCKKDGADGGFGQRDKWNRLAIGVRPCEINAAQTHWIKNDPHQVASVAQ